MNASDLHKLLSPIFDKICPDEYINDVINTIRTKFFVSIDDENFVVTFRSYNGKGHRCDRLMYVNCYEELKDIKENFIQFINHSMNEIPDYDLISKIIDD